MITRRGVTIARLVPERARTKRKVDWTKSAAFQLDRLKLRPLTAQESAEMLKLNRGPCSKWDPDAQGRYANIEVAYLLQKTEEVTRRSLLSLLYHYRKGMRTTISSKGQITVPVAVRKALGLHPGAKLDIRLGNNAEFIVSRATGKSFFSEFKGICRKKAPWPSGREAVEKLRGPVGHGDVDSS